MGEQQGIISRGFLQWKFHNIRSSKEQYNLNSWGYIKNNRNKSLLILIDILGKPL